MSKVRTVEMSKATSAELVSILEQDGCVVLKDVLNTKALSKLQNELETKFEATPVCQGNFFGFATKRISAVLGCSTITREIAVHPMILNVMDYFLLKSCRQYQLNLTQAIQILPGELEQLIHTDDVMFPVELNEPGAQKMINCMWAVNDFTSANGATRLVVGSHTWPRDRQPKKDEVTAAEMPAGSVLFWLGSLLHAGGANKTSSARSGLTMSYCLGWLRQAENHYLSLPLELVKTFPERLQILLGYFIHEPNLGAVSGRNPIELLQDGAGKDCRFEEFIPAEFHEALADHRRIAKG